MSPNTELQRLVFKAGSVRNLARILGLHRTHLHRQVRLGYLSAAASLRAASAYPGVDVAKLIRKPKG